MQVNVAKEIAALRKLTMRELRAKCAEAFGDATNANNKAWLLKRIIWRFQANAEGDLTERAKRRAAELANDADLRLAPPKLQPEPASQSVHIAVISVGNENRLPPAGTVLTREYKGEMLRVTVLADGFEFEGERYKSLSAVAQVATGQHMNGFAFFKLTKGVAS